MKKLALTWLCLTLTTAFTLASDYYLFETQMVDVKDPPTVWVLIQPDGQQPLVFQKFDSWMMEARLGRLPRGSVLHVHGSRMLVDTNFPAEAFKALCQKQGIKYVDDTPAD